MRRVTGEKNTPLLITFGNQAVARPWTHGQKFERNVFTQRMAELLRRVERIQMFLADASNVQTPQLAPIHGGDSPLDLRIDDLILHRPTGTAPGQPRRAGQCSDGHSLGETD